jgi:sulfofructose kinase
MIDVAGVGANSIDDVLQIPVDIHALADSGKVRITGRASFCGGQTATAMCACAALGLRAAYIGAFGSDDRGTRMRAELTARGVDVRHARDDDAPNAGAVIVVDGTGQRTVLWERDERLRLTPEQIAIEVLQSAKVIHVDDVDGPAALYACAVARQSGVPVTSDIEQVTDGTEAIVRAVTHPIFDHNAPAMLTGESDPERALRKLRRWNPGLLCMTLGAGGAAALDGDRFYLSPAIKVTTIDTTAAGDVFRAGLIYGLLQSWPVADMLRFANAAAAISCTRRGAIASVPSLEEVRTLNS